MICWVHGAKASPRSFNYLLGLLPDHALMMYEYRVETPLRDNIARLEELAAAQSITRFVGHSLGGVIAAEMVKRHGGKGVAIASPLGGSDLANFMPVSQMLFDVASLQPIFRGLNAHTFNTDFLSIVASNDGGYSDGVITVKSQKGARGSLLAHFDANHFEVLLDPAVAELIRNHLFIAAPHRSAAA